MVKRQIPRASKDGRSCRGRLAVARTVPRRHAFAQLSDPQCVRIIYDQKDSRRKLPAVGGQPWPYLRCGSPSFYWLQIIIFAGGEDPLVGKPFLRETELFVF